MPALERYLQEMNEDQPQHQQQQQQQQLGIDNITVDVHNSDDATDDDSDCRQSPLDRRHSDGQRFHHSSRLPNSRDTDRKFPALLRRFRMMKVSELLNDQSKIMVNNLLFYSQPI